MRNRVVAATTTEGPAGVSQRVEAHKPSPTAAQPNRLASAAMPSGERANRRAAAAGMISSEVMSRMPTTFIARAMTMAMSSMNASRTGNTATPSTCASSSWTVAASSGRHNPVKAPSASRLPAQIQPRSVALIDRMSPNK